MERVGDYNGVISKILGDEWVNLRILSIQSLEAHHQAHNQDLLKMNINSNS